LNVIPTTGTPNSGSVDDFRVTTTAGFPNTKLHLATNILMYSRAAANSVIPIGEFSAGLGATISAGFGTSAGTQSAVTWRVGGLNTDATNAALFQGTTSLIKEGIGRWTLTGDNTYTGTTTVNGGSLVVNGDQSAAAGNVTVNANGTLAGNGVIGGSTVVNGMLSPGANGIGTLTLSGDLTLNSGGTVFFEISKSPPANDQVVIGGTVHYAGALDVVNISPDLLQAGDNFQLFSGPANDGAFNTFNLPALDLGLAWNTSQLAVDGRLWVVSTNPPLFSSVVRSNAQLVLSGQGGTPGWEYLVLASTNAELPVALWTAIATNQFDSTGAFRFDVPIALDPARRFFRLLTP
jgi:autotransporter-associated beta strand protein